MLDAIIVSTLAVVKRMQTVAAVYDRRQSGN
jgi:hypothetical protein